VQKWRVLPAVVTLSPVFNEEGVSIGIFGISREIPLFRIIQEAHWKFLTNDQGRGLPVVDDMANKPRSRNQEYARTVAALWWPSGDRINERRHDRQSHSTCSGSYRNGFRRERLALLQLPLRSTLLCLINAAYSRVLASKLASASSCTL
jgi:hypothetical protein